MISIQNLIKDYRQGFWLKSVRALRGMNLEVQKGDLYGFIGPNGAGKSTTIKVLLGLARATSGQVEILGSHPADVAHRAKLGYMPEQPYFYEGATGWETLAYCGKLTGMHGQNLKAEIQRALQIARADQDWVHRPMRQYSKGMQQRIGLAQAILHRPELLLLDEPMSGLDPVGRRDLREAMLQLHREGTTLFFSSHVLSDVEALCNRVGMVVGGEMRVQGEVEALLAQGQAAYRFRLQQNITHIDFAGVQALGGGEWLLSQPEKAQELQQYLTAQNWTLTHWESRRENLENLLSKELAR